MLLKEVISKFDDLFRTYFKRHRAIQEKLEVWIYYAGRTLQAFNINIGDDALL